MFQIACDGNALHDSRTEDYLLMNPSVTKEDNKAGSLKFEMMPTHPYYNNIKKLQSEITVYRNGKWYWTGRVVSDNIGFDLVKDIECEGELAYLLDSNQKLAEYHEISVVEYFTALITKHNNQVESKKQFEVGQVTVTDSNDSLYRYNNWEDTWSTIQVKLVKRLGGHIRTQHSDDGKRYIDYIESYENINDQVIEAGENLIDIIIKNTATDIATAIIPLGCKLESENKSVDKRLTIESINGNIDYVYDQVAVNNFGWIYKVVKYDDVTNPTELKKLGLDELNKYTGVKRNLEVKAFDLSLTDDQVEELKVGDMIHAKSEKHNIDEYFECTKITLDIDNPQSSSISLGKTIKTMTETTVNTDKKIENIIANYVTNEEVKDVIDSITEVKSAIEQTALDVTISAESLTELKKDYESFKEERSASFTLTDDAIDIKFKEASEALTALNGVVDGNRQLIESYIRFTQDLMEMGVLDSPFVMRLSSTSIGFYNDNQLLAEMSGEYLIINKAKFRNGIEFLGKNATGCYRYIAEDNGSLSLEWMDFNQEEVLLNE